ncbi:saccharopine dehydrogenase family protein [Paenibacillus arenosi]|uniref:Saccharopine dehydrogenase NADP-binding domain-containing protein n=1 Tax=Paenibacillus arenosi TaxID=2774142 RepID=A0ABR9AVA2_9BACL|nr:saccharopine dehydrogenase NADP-binding domain-containing protein [Paenibacillus arenosi]MBD8497999.1 saccharopine dehydrogenase NADP-binding domain-containing protein [Paenibacillus arenosi]
MNDRIIVIGGYGHVGQAICKQLADDYPGKVYAAGRSLERAEQFCLTTNSKVKPFQIDVRSKVTPSLLDNVKLVIMCLDQTNTAFVETCLQRGIHYVDVSANPLFLSQVEQLHQTAASYGATAVLSVGLAPGITNLLAKQAKSLMDQTETVDISIMLGLGDSHGNAAIEWTIDNVSTQFEIMHNGQIKKVSSFTDGKNIEFGAELGRKRAYRFNFSDQHAIPRTLAIPTVSTRLCFDSNSITRMLAWLRATGLFHLLKIKPIRQFAVLAFSKIRLGSDQFAVKVDAQGKQNNEDVSVECLVRGRHEANMTAAVATAVATAIYRSPMPYGVYHIEQLFQLLDLLPTIEQIAAIDIRANGEVIVLQ